MIFMSFVFNFYLLNFNLTEVFINFLIVVLIAFILIVLISSYLRFQDIIDFVKNSNSENNDIKISNLIRIKLADVISRNLKKKTSFSVILIKFNISNQTNLLNDQFIDHIEKYFRNDDLFFKLSGTEIISIIECDEEFIRSLIDRLIKLANKFFDNFSKKDVYFGISRFPNCGTTGDELINLAQKSILKADSENQIIFAESQNDEDSNDKNIKEENLDDKDKLYDKKIIDPLTNTLNQKAVSKFMQREISELRIKKEPCTIFCIKINNIYNTESYFGKDSVEYIIKSIGNLINENIRGSDIVGTYKFGEFMILSHSELEKASNIGNRLTSLVNKKRFNFDGKIINNTLTIGAASYPEHGNNIYDLYKKTQKVLDYCNENDISGYMVYEENKHNL